MQTASHRPAIHPYVGIAIGIVAVAAASIIVKKAQAEGVPSLIIAAFRLSLASLALSPIALTRCRAELASLDRRDFLLAALGGVFLGAHFASWISSLEYTTVASSVVIVSASPLFVGLFSWMVWRERFGPPLLAGLFITLIGGAVVGLSDACAVTGGQLTCPPLAQFAQGRAFLGDGLALIGAMAMAGYLLIGRRLRAKLSLISHIFLGYSAAAITLLIAAALGDKPLWGYSAWAYVWMILLALIPQLIGHSAFNWALRYLSATYVSVTILGEPIGSTALAFLLLNETPSSLKLFGGALILGGILLASGRS